MESLPANTGLAPISPPLVGRNFFARTDSLPTARSRARAVQILGLPLVVVLAALIAYNVVIARTARSSQRRQLLARIDNIPAETDCLFLGNSLVEAGCDTQSFESDWPDAKTRPNAMNVALGATSTVEHYLILKRVLEIHPRLKYLIYGFFDDQLSTTTSGDWSDLVGNRAFSYYFPNDAAEMYAPGSWLKRCQLQLSAHLPMLAERSSLWGKVDELRRRVDEIGLPKHEVNRFGRVNAFGALEAADAASFERRCRVATDSQKSFSRPIQEIIRLAETHGASVILVEMPMPSRHRSLFYSSTAWTNLRHHVQSLASQQGARYLCASDWIVDDTDFEDATHLNEQGARRFSSKLAEAVAGISAHPDVAHR